jgi:integrase
MASIKKREQAGKVTWRVRWWADGKQRCKSFERYDEAKRFKAVLEGDVANGTWLDPKHGQETVKAFSERWWPSVHDLRATSKAQLKSCMDNHVLPEFGGLPLSGVTHTHVQAWVTQMTPNMAASTVRKNVFALRRLMKSAIQHGHIKTNPADDVSLPTASKDEQRFLTKEEINRLLLAIRPRYKAMVQVAAFGGLRFGELCALRRSSVDVAKSTVRVSQTLVDVNNTVTFGPPKTKTSIRTVTLPRSVMDSLVHHMSEFVEPEQDALVFTFANATAIRRSWFRQRVWLPATKKAGLSGLRFHDLRHTFVALWVSLGRNAKEVSKVAGHSSVAFTLDRYGHLYDTDDSGLSDSLDKMLGA